MSELTGRAVSAVVSCEEQLLGVIGPFPVDRPRWHDVEPVAARLSELLGVPVAVLRLLDVEGGADGRGGHVSYHVEALRPPARSAVGRPVTPAEQAALRPHPLRAGFATAAGVRAALAWAETALAAAGRPATGPAEQVKTWNLAALFRLPTAAGPVWLKTGPRFAVAESAVIELFAGADPGLVPTVLAAEPDRRRLLLDHVPGEDCWGPSAAAVADAVPRLVAAQAALAARFPSAPPGLPDRSPRALAAGVAGLLDGPAGRQLTTGERREASLLLKQLPSLIADLESCGLPDTVLHGDFHPGNWRSDGRHAVVVDFADSFHGHPALDGLRPRDFTSPERWTQLTEVWTAAWRAQVPGADPARALTLAEPLVHLGYALRYQEFLDGIEPSEHRYHAGDPVAELRAALTSARPLLAG